MNGFYSNKTLEINNKIGKFKNDCFVIENNKYKVFSEGYFLNKKGFTDLYCADDFISALFCCVDDVGGLVCTKLYGSYLLVIQNKVSGDLLICNDLLSKHSLYYGVCQKGSEVCFSDSFLDLINTMKNHGVDITVDWLGVDMMNYHQIFYDDITYVNEVKFLRPYNYLIIKNGQLIVEQIPINSIEHYLPDDDVVAKLDVLFGEAVQLEYKKNDEYGYKQVMTLSAGMDSRTTFLYGMKLGYSNQLCFSYAESGSVDAEISKKIAEDNNCQYYFSSISGGEFLLNRNNILDANEGQMTYGGTTGLFDAVSRFSSQDWGFVHTGLGGGEIMGDLCVADENQGWESFKQVFINNGKDRINNIINNYESYNVFANINDIRRCLNAQKTAHNMCEYVSPFLYEKFFDYVIQLPYEIKADRKIYRKWVNQYCPSSYTSTYHMGAKTNSKLEYYLRWFLHKQIAKRGGKTKYDMNPFQYWEKTNLELINNLNYVFESDINNLRGKCSENKLDELCRLYGEFPLYEKMNVLTTTWVLNKII